MKEQNQRKGNNMKEHFIVELANYLYKINQNGIIMTDYEKAFEFVKEGYEKIEFTPNEIILDVMNQYDKINRQAKFAEDVE